MKPSRLLNKHLCMPIDFWTCSPPVIPNTYVCITEIALNSEFKYIRLDKVKFEKESTRL